MEGYDGDKYYMPVKNEFQIPGSSTQISKAVLFIIGTYIILFISILLVIGVGGGMIYVILSACYGISDAAGSSQVTIPVGLILAVGAGCIYGIMSICKGIFSCFSSKNKRNFQMGILINKNEQPKLYEFISELCKGMNTEMPENIILHAEPVFFVKHGNSTLADEKISGRTLAIGLPLLRYLNINELRAILAHEFAHFTGKDTTYSVIYYPVYLSTVTSIINLQQYINAYSRVRNGWIYQIPMLIPNYLLKSYYNSFNKSNRKLSRLREKRADLIAEKYCGGKSIKDGLKKVYSFSNVFLRHVRYDIQNLYKSKKVFINYYQFFNSKSEFVNPEAERELSSELKKESGLYDTHPSLTERLNYITSNNEVFSDNNAAIDLFDNVQALEEKMTKLYSEYLVIINKWQVKEENK